MNRRHLTKAIVVLGCGALAGCDAGLSRGSAFDAIADGGPASTTDAEVARDAELVTRDAELVTRDAELVTRDAELLTRDAELVTRYRVTVHQGKGSGQYRQGEQVMIEALMLEGQVFVEWLGDVAHLAESGAPVQTFEMPASDLSFEATYREQLPSDCVMGDVSVAHGSSQTFYSEAQVSYGERCEDFAQQRSCDDGTLSGDSVFDKLSCSEEAPSDCVVGGVTVPHGDSRTFYAQELVAYGKTCAAVAQARTCSNGVLSGSATCDEPKCVAMNSPIYRKVIHDTPGKHEAFPKIARLDDKRLAVLFRAGADGHHDWSNASALKMSISPDFGWSWKAAVTIADKPGYGDSVGAITTTSSGRIVVSYSPYRWKPGTTSRDWDFGVLYSDDKGASWPKIAGGYQGIAATGQIVESGNRLLMPAYFGAIRGAGYQISNDDGITWSSNVNVMPYVRNATGYDEVYNESAILPTSGGGMLAIIRGKRPSAGPAEADDQLYKAVSGDGGATWSDPQLLFSGHAPELMRLKSGKILLCVSDRRFGANAFTKGVRCHLSADEGQSWSQGTRIYHNTICWDSGYPTTVQHPKDGRLVTAFYFNNAYCDLPGTPGYDPYDFEIDTGIQRAIYFEDYIQ